MPRGSLGEPSRVGRQGLPAAGSDVLGDRGAALPTATTAPARIGGARTGDVRQVASAGHTERGEGVRPWGSHPAVTRRHAADATPSDPGHEEGRRTGQRALTGRPRRAGVRTAGIRRPASPGRRRTAGGRSPRCRCLVSALELARYVCSPRWAWRRDAVTHAGRGRESGTARRIHSTHRVDGHSASASDPANALPVRGLPGVALAGESRWVRNVRAAGGRAVIRRRGARQVHLEEMDLGCAGGTRPTHSEPVTTSASPSLPRCRPGRVAGRRRGRCR